MAGELILPIPEHLRKRPAVHELTYGAFVQETVHLGGLVVATPCIAVGFESEASYAATYVQMIGGAVDAPAFGQLVQQGVDALPVIALVAQPSVLLTTAEQAEAAVRPDLERARLVIAWATGEYPTVFAVVTAVGNQTFFRLVAPQSRRRLRLGLGNTGEDFARTVNRISTKTEKDEHFAFALSLFHDALHDPNARFRTARFFSCLEALAYRLKGGGVGSRDAVRKLLGLSDIASTIQVSVDGQTMQADAIALAGRLRDLLFHGRPFERRHLPQEFRHTYDLVEKAPDQLADSLQSYCEVELARWANDASEGQRATTTATE